MANKSITNTFSNGLMMDFNELTNYPSDSSLTNCLNGTFITYNGNEFVLQNDMGNGKIESAKLPEGYIPTGISSFGGIIYLTSYNPFTKKGQVGSFPSPERNFSLNDSQNEMSFVERKNFFDYREADPEKRIKSTTERMSVFGNDTILNPGDCFSIYIQSESNDIKERLLKIIETKDFSEEKTLMTMDVGILKDNNITIITDTLKKLKDNWNESTINGISFADWFLYGLSTERNEFPLNKTNESVSPFNEVGPVPKELFTYLISKLSGNIVLIFKLKMIDNFTVSILGTKHSFDSVGLTAISLDMNCTFTDDNIRTIKTIIKNNNKKTSFIDKDTINNKEYYYDKENGIILRRYIYNPKIEDTKIFNEGELLYNDYEHDDFGQGNSDLSTIEGINNYSTLDSPVKMIIGNKDYPEDGYINKSDAVSNYGKCLMYDNMKLDSLNSEPLSFSVTPGTCWGLLSMYSVTGYLDAKLIGSGAIQLTNWRYFKQDNYTKLNIAMNSYLRENEDLIDWRVLMFDQEESSDNISKMVSKGKCSQIYYPSEDILKNNTNFISVYDSFYLTKYKGETTMDVNNPDGSWNKENNNNKELFHDTVYLCAVEVRKRVWSSDVHDEEIEGSYYDENIIIGYRYLYTTNVFNGYYNTTNDFERLEIEPQILSNISVKVGLSNCKSTVKSWNGNKVYDDIDSNFVIGYNFNQECATSYFINEEGKNWDMRFTKCTDTYSVILNATQKEDLLELSRYPFEYDGSDNDIYLKSNYDKGSITDINRNEYNSQNIIWNDYDANDDFDLKLGNDNIFGINVQYNILDDTNKNNIKTQLVFDNITGFMSPMDALKIIDADNAQELQPYVCDKNEYDVLGGKKIESEGLYYPKFASSFGNCPDGYSYIYGTVLSNLGVITSKKFRPTMCSMHYVRLLEYGEETLTFKGWKLLGTGDKSVKIKYKQSFSDNGEAVGGPNNNIKDYFNKNSVRFVTEFVSSSETFAYENSWSYNGTWTEHSAERKSLIISHSFGVRPIADYDTESAEFLNITVSDAFKMINMSPYYYYERDNAIVLVDFAKMYYATKLGYVNGTWAGLLWGYDGMPVYPTKEETETEEEYEARVELFFNENFTGDIVYTNGTYDWMMNCYTTYYGMAPKWNYVETWESELTPEMIVTWNTNTSLCYYIVEYNNPHGYIADTGSTFDCPFAGVTHYAKYARQSAWECDSDNDNDSWDGKVWDSQLAIDSFNKYNTSESESYAYLYNKKLGFTPPVQFVTDNYRSVYSLLNTDKDSSAPAISAPEWMLVKWPGYTDDESIYMSFDSPISDDIYCQYGDDNLYRINNESLIRDKGRTFSAFYNIFNNIYVMQNGPLSNMSFMTADNSYKYIDCLDESFNLKFNIDEDKSNISNTILRFKNTGKEFNNINFETDFNNILELNYLGTKLNGVCNFNNILTWFNERKIYESGKRLIISNNKEQSVKKSSTENIKLIIAKYINYDVPDDVVYMFDNNDNIMFQYSNEDGILYDFPKDYHITFRLDNDNVIKRNIEEEVFNVRNSLYNIHWKWKVREWNKSNPNRNCLYLSNEMNSDDNVDIMWIGYESKYEDGADVGLHEYAEDWHKSSEYDSFITFAHTWHKSSQIFPPEIDPPSDVAKWVYDNGQKTKIRIAKNLITSI